MPDIKGRDLRVLPESEYKTAILGVVKNSTDTADTDQITIAELAEASQAENALNIANERVELVSFSTSDYVTESTQTAETPNALDGTHSFDDGYSLIEFEYFYSFTRSGTTYPFVVPFFVSIHAWENSNNSDRLELFHEHFFWRSTDTAFGFYYGEAQESYQYLKAVYGHKHITEITTP